jgi:DNA-binding Lrp family transcriptional regulator
MATHADICKMKERLSSKTITLNDLDAFYRETDPCIPKTTVNWRVHDLVRSGILQRTGKGVYRFGEMQIFMPKANSRMKRIGRFLKKRFPLIQYCLWDLSCINYFSQHLINFNVLFVDVERDAVDAVYRALKEELPKVMSIHHLYDNLSEFDGAVFVRSLVSESPVRKVENIPVTTLEKLLVDLATDKEFISFQDNEIYTIFETAFEKYTVNRNTLLRYASRKHKKEETEKIITTINRQ